MQKQIKFGWLNDFCIRKIIVNHKLRIKRYTNRRRIYD